jgi:peptidoglycan/xylan/chitin deacetylase (PgdA/CDA1 family)
MPASVRSAALPVPVLMYHSVSAPAKASPAFRRYTVDPSRFRAHLQWLIDNGWSTADDDTYVGEPGSPTVVLTFDDGFADFHQVALPTLADLGLRGTLYVTTGYLDRTSSWLEHAGEGGRRMLSWSQLAEIAQAGIRIGAHTHTHPQLDLLRPDRLRDEVRRPKGMLEDRLGVAVESFAYPFGYYDRAVLREVRAAGYRRGYAVRDLVLPDRGARFTLPRLTVTDRTGVTELARMLAQASGPRRRLESFGRARASSLLRRLGAKKRQVGRD